MNRLPFHVYRKQSWYSPLICRCADHYFVGCRKKNEETLEIYFDSIRIDDRHLIGKVILFAEEEL